MRQCLLCLLFLPFIFAGCANYRFEQDQSESKVRRNFPSEPLQVVASESDLSGLDPLQRAAYSSVVQIPWAIDDARGGKRMLSVRLPGEEIPLGLKLGIYRNSEYLWRVIDSIPLRSHLYSRSEVTVYDAVLQIFSSGQPGISFGRRGMVFTPQSVYMAESTLYAQPLFFPRQAGPSGAAAKEKTSPQYDLYRKYELAYAEAFDALKSAESKNQGVETTRVKLRQAALDWEKLGNRTAVDKALAVYSTKPLDALGIWLEAESRLARASHVYSIGDSIPYVDLVPTYEEWSEDSGWTQVKIQNADVNYGSMSIKVVHLSRSWLPGEIFTSNSWAWSEAKSRALVSTGDPFSGSESQLLPLIPISLILARDITIAHPTKGYTLEDRSRSHVRLVGVVTAIVPQCP